MSRLVFLQGTSALATPSEPLVTEVTAVTSAAPFLLGRRRGGTPAPRGDGGRRTPPAIQAAMARRIPPTPVVASWRAASNTVIATLDRTAPVIPKVVSYDDAAGGYRGHLPRPPHGRRSRSGASAAPFSGSSRRLVCGRFPALVAATDVSNPAPASPPPTFDQAEDEDFQLALDLLSRPPTPESAPPPRLLTIPFSPLLHMGGDVSPDADRSKPPRLPPPRSRPVGLPTPGAKRAHLASDVDLAGESMPPEKSSKSSRGRRQVESVPPKAAKKRKVGGRRQRREVGCSGDGGGGEEKKREEKAAAAVGGHEDSKRRRFNREEEVALLRGIVKHGRGKWRAIYDDEPLLNRNIQASALKDRVRSKRFAELLKRAEADPALLSRPDELCGAADQEVYGFLLQDAGSGCETPAAKTKRGSRRPPSRRAEHRGRAGKAPLANAGCSPPSLDSPPQSHGVMVHGARGHPGNFLSLTGLQLLPPMPPRGEERIVEEATVTVRAEV